jgi:hypothetical protein
MGLSLHLNLYFSKFFIIVRVFSCLTLTLSDGLRVELKASKSKSIRSNFDLRIAKIANLPSAVS